MMAKFLFATSTVLLFAATTVAQTSSELAKDYETLISKFDTFYFELYEEARYDELALKCGYGDTPETTKSKIARLGNKRYQHRKHTPVPGPEPKYVERASACIFDGSRSMTAEGVLLYIQKSKNLDCELNGAFYALGWGESKEALAEPRDPKPWHRQFVVEMLRDEAGKWSVKKEKLGDVDCLVANSDEFKTTFWFNAKTMMPLKYVFVRCDHNIYNKTVEFLDYQLVESSDLMFPQKIVVSCDLFNASSGDAEGKSVVTLKISNPSAKVSEDLFQVDEKKYEQITDLDERTTRPPK